MWHDVFPESTASRKNGQSRVTINFEVIKTSPELYTNDSN